MASVTALIDLGRFSFYTCYSIASISKEYLKNMLATIQEKIAAMIALLPANGDFVSYEQFYNQAVSAGLEGAMSQLHRLKAQGVIKLQLTKNGSKTVLMIAKGA